MAYKLVFKIIRYYPQLKGSIIDRSWRGGSTSSSIAELGASAARATSGEGLEDEEGLQEVWTMTGDGLWWEGCGVDVVGARTTIGCGVEVGGVGTTIGSGVGTMVGCGVGTT